MNEATQKTETPRPILYSEYQAIAVDMFRAQCPTVAGFIVTAEHFEKVIDELNIRGPFDGLTKQAAEYWLQVLSDALNKAANVRTVSGAVKL